MASSWLTVNLGDVVAKSFKYSKAVIASSLNKAVAPAVKPNAWSSTDPSSLTHVWNVEFHGKTATVSTLVSLYAAHFKTVCADIPAEASTAATKRVIFFMILLVLVVKLSSKIEGWENYTVFYQAKKRVISPYRNNHFDINTTSFDFTLAITPNLGFFYRFFEVPESCAARYFSS